MPERDLVDRYNYDAFVPAKFEPWLNFAGSPPLGEPAPDFPLWPLGGGETRLSAIWTRYAFTVVEFGSFS
jgi:hypothetical protein